MSAAEDSAIIWKVVAPSKTRTRPGKVIASRLTRIQANEMVELLRKDGIDCEIGRA